MRVRIDQWIKIVFRKVEHKQYRYIVILHTFGGKLQKKSNQVKKKKFHPILFLLFCIGFIVFQLYVIFWHIGILITCRNSENIYKKFKFVKITE